MRRLKIYLDTSVINFFDAPDSPVYMALTKEFFEKHLENYDVFISDVVVLEITRTPVLKRKNALMGLIRKFNLKIFDSLNAEIEQLADRYISAGVIPENKLNDALHIAFSTYFEFDILLSWNFRHLSNVRKQIAINTINRSEGYLKTLLLLNPMEVIGDE
ncbi:MAG: PIN domain-containing protein [Candidatus Wallbacteria bacterium]|nr:PIN domain-containing protein [Candidatus Wallbacteria bacterium]